MGRALRWGVAAACGTLVVPLTLGLAGLRVNQSPSVAGLFWWTTPVTASSPLTLGTYVIVCPQSHPMLALAGWDRVATHGDCAGKAPLLKRVVAVTGDAVTLSQNGVSVNAIHMPHSAVVPGVVTYPTPSRTLVLSASRVVVLGDTPASFDSRYLGPIPRHWVTARAWRIY